MFDKVSKTDLYKVVWISHNCFSRFDVHLLKKIELS